jgi:hypothetical protein
MTKHSADQIREEWLAIRKRAGEKIDPETAKVHWENGVTADPYGLNPEFPDEYFQIGRIFFARSPESDTWVWFGDLPTATRNALWKRIREWAISSIDDCL